MPLIKPTSEIPALRLLLQCSDDAAAADLALESATMIAGDRGVIVVNGAPNDVACLARRHDFLLLVGADGLPARTVGAIADELDQLEPGEAGAVVFLNVAGIARGSRCSTRHIKDIEKFLPGHWDDLNEALWAMQERLNRLGIHAIYCAPSTPDRGVGSDGEEVTLNTNGPQGWKDLPRSVHAWIEVSMKAGRSVATVRRDDTRMFGESIEATAAGIVGPLMSLVRTAKPAAASSTLVESAKSELAARERLDARAVRRSSEARERLVGLAMLRIVQGPEAWSDHLADTAASAHLLASHDAAVVDSAISTTSQNFDAVRRWHAAALTHLEGAPLGVSLDVLRPRGPAPESCTVDRRSDHDEVIAQIGPNMDRDTIIAAIRGMAEDCGLWSRWQLAGVVAVAGINHFSPAWSAYSTETLFCLASTLRMLDGSRRSYERAKAEPIEAAEPVFADVVEMTDEEIAAEFDEPVLVTTAHFAEPIAEPIATVTGLARGLPDFASTTSADEVERRLMYLIDGGDSAAPERKPSAGPSMPLPSEANFAALDRRSQVVFLTAALATIGGFDRWPEIQAADPRVGTCRKPERWADDEMIALYNWATRELSMRRAA